MDVLMEIQKWFQEHCDGEWEQHETIISILSCDNPGWWVKININRTNLKNKKFKEIIEGDFSRNNPSPPWIHVYVENGVFNAAGDVMQLKNLLQYFLDWAMGKKGDRPQNRG